MPRNWTQRLRGNRYGTASIMAILRLSPAAIYALNGTQVNNLDPLNGSTPGAIGTINRLNFTGTGPTVITGILAGSDGQLLWLRNSTNADITLPLNNAGSAAANQFDGFELAIPAGGSLLIHYDTTAARWITGV